MSLRVALILAFLFLPALAHAEVRVPSLIGDNMVLQQDRKVRIWGTAAAGETITVSFHNEQKSALADPTGHWQVLMGPYKAGGPFVLRIHGTNTLTFQNILIGEVWICSGQSNMEWPLINTTNGAETVAQANYPEIRLFTVQKALPLIPDGGSILLNASIESKQGKPAFLRDLRTQWEQQGYS